METKNKNKTEGTKLSPVPFILGALGLLSGALGATAIGIAVNNSNTTTTIIKPAEPTTPDLENPEIIEKVEANLSDIEKFIAPGNLITYKDKQMYVSGNWGAWGTNTNKQWFVEDWFLKTFTKDTINSGFVKSEITDYNFITKSLGGTVSSYRNVSVYFSFKGRIDKEEKFKSYITKLNINY